MLKRYLLKTHTVILVVEPFLHFISKQLQKPVKETTYLAELSSSCWKVRRTLQHGRRNFIDTNLLMLSSLVILFGVVKQFGRF
jgi:hypothetical protein